MTEKEWLAGNCLDALLKYVQKSKRRGPSRRKLALFSCGCARRLSPQLNAVLHLAKGLDLAEQSADGLLKEKQIRQYRRSLRTRPYGDPRAATVISWCLRLPEDQLSSPEYAARSAAVCARREVGQAEEIVQCELLRDIVGNPFRPVAFDPRWRTADTVGLARGIYEDRAFDRLPLLADALMDAGCADEQVLGHCRSDGPHVRGCWVVDLVLSKDR
jgi:hypothetical protein